RTRNTLALCGLQVLYPDPLAGFEKAICIQVAVQLDKPRDQAGPPRLMAGAQPGTVVAVEVFVEKDAITPMRVGLELPRSAIYRPPSPFIRKKDARQPAT